MALVGRARRFDIVLVNLDPTVGSEIQKTRPCLIVSPDEMNRHLRTVIVAPMTTGGQAYPSREPIRFQRKQGHVALDQVRAVDRDRLVKRLGAADKLTAAAVAAKLVEMFALGSG